MQYLTILGSTGSIGKATLSVVQQNSDKFSIYALVAKDNVNMLTKQCLIVCPKYACMTNKNAAKELKHNLMIAGKDDIEVLDGILNACELAAIDSVDMVMSAITGMAGLKPTFSAIRAGKKILLANKEVLVACGQLFMKTAYEHHAYILPVDSEHNAIFQNLPLVCQNKLGCISSLSEYGISHITLTASGGIFLKTPLDKLSKITPDQACIHPNWIMGRKISIDSATMMNKGLEYIEALHLFNAKPDEIKILLHPQSIVHSMVHYNDGSVLTHIAPPDMRVSIAYALGYPNRINVKNLPKLDINCLNKLYFEELNINHYPCLKLAIDANNQGQSEVIILNAANEIAVEAFLQKMICFTEIPNLINYVLDSIYFDNPDNIDDILYIDNKARKTAIQYLVHHV